jgi:hypothetical protein
LHGLLISIRGHDGKWPVSTVKFAQSYLQTPSNTLKPPASIE